MGAGVQVRRIGQFKKSRSLISQFNTDVPDSDDAMHHRTTTDINPSWKSILNNWYRNDKFANALPLAQFNGYVCMGFFLCWRWCVFVWEGHSMRPIRMDPKLHNAIQFILQNSDGTMSTLPTSKAFALE